MSLFCNTDYDSDEGDWWYNSVEDLLPLPTKRSRKCCSCGTKIHVGTPARAFYRYRAPHERCNYIEEAIYGDEVPLSTWYMCETCGDLYDSITELGFCCDIGRNLKSQIREYRAEGGTL